MVERSPLSDAETPVLAGPGDRCDTAAMRRFSLFLALCATVPAQDARQSQDELLSAKLASPFLAKARWFTDWDEALAAARREDRLLFAYFTTVNY
jgi:hypothetical protein